MDKGEEKLWMLFINIGLQCDPLRGFKNDQCLSIILSDYDLTELGPGLFTKIVSSSALILMGGRS